MKKILFITLVFYGAYASAQKVNAEVIDFDTAAAATVGQGQMAWNADEETIDLGLNGATLQMGQEVHYHVRNNTVSTIADGVAVMATGTLGASGRIAIDEFVNDGTIAPEYFIGITTESIANGTDGKVTHFGKVRGIDTSGTPYGEVWSDGDLIYLSETTPGWLTNVKPSAPSLKLAIAIVINAHASSGTLFVRARIGNGIDDLHDVQETALADGDFLKYNSTNSRWENVTLVEADISDLGSYVDLSSTQTITSEKAFNRLNITGTTAGYWGFIYDSGSSNGLVLGYQLTDGFGSGLNVPYSFRTDGSAVAGTDVITKTYADANYGFSSTDIDTFAELDAIVADKSLANLNDAQTFSAAQTFSTSPKVQTYLSLLEDGGLGSVSGYASLSAVAGNGFRYLPANETVGVTFDWPDITAERTITLPNADVNLTSVINSDLTGYGSGVTAVDNVVVWDYDVNPTEPTPGTNDVVLGKNVPLAGSFSGTTIPLDSYTQHDDSTTDTATWTIDSTPKNGGVSEILINLASEPAPFSTDTGVTQISGTTNFAANTLQLLTVKVISGTVYYFYTTL